VELPLAAWPEADRIAWSDLFRKGDLLDGQGAAVHWAEATRRTNRKHYARWLGWLAANDLMPVNLAPWERVTRSQISGYRAKAARPEARTLAAKLSSVRCPVLVSLPKSDHSH